MLGSNPVNTTRRRWPLRVRASVIAGGYFVNRSSSRAPVDIILGRAQQGSPKEFEGEPRLGYRNGRWFFEGG
jgi:hypothetical protein